MAETAAVSLRAAGVTVTRADVGPGLPPLDTGLINSADVVAVAGGDGTVLSVAPACAATGVPIYHLPAGNENLFARQFGGSRDPARLLWALDRRRVTRCDVGQCVRNRRSNPAPFLLMASIGPDAGVCHRLHASRTRASGYNAYIGPIIDEFGCPALARVKVWCDGRPIIDARGMLVVANCRQYAFRMDPCPDADINDGQLDIAFVPADTSIDALVGLARLRLRCPGPDLIRARGRLIRIESDSTARLQVDGEASDWQPEGGPATIELSVLQSHLPILDAR